MCVLVMLTSCDVLCNICCVYYCNHYCRHDITSPEFAEQLRPFLFEQTEHFVHEFVSFAQSPCDMVAYDDKAEYDIPSDGTHLPELQPMDNDEPGMNYCMYCLPC